MLAKPFHRQFLALVAQIESGFPVAEWRSGDVDIWPLARMDLYLDMYWQNVGGAPPKARPRALRLLRGAATPLINIWKSRRDLHHWVGHAKSAHAVFLGDGVSLDSIDGAWQDRYGEPIFVALEHRGLSTFLMQSGELLRLPWRRDTYAANLIARRGSLARLIAPRAAQMPAHEEVMALLKTHEVAATSLDRLKLEQRASVVSATASAFERVLRKVNPALAFVVTYYAGLGAAFVLACRRLGILSVDLQHCPQDGAHKAYGWDSVPEHGYRTLPAVFWTWTARDAQDIRRWTDRLAQPWHRSVYGGHTQFSAFFSEHRSRRAVWDGKFAAMAKDARFDREILVALQPVGGFREEWDQLAVLIQAAPAGWRWWIRRHPATADYQDQEYLRLISLRADNVKVQESSSLPLPALLQHMSVVVSRFSGAAVEAASIGVPAIFLSEEARGQFSDLIDRGAAIVVPVSELNAAIDNLPMVPERSGDPRFPSLESTLQLLEHYAADYARLCRAEK